MKTKPDFATDLGRTEVSLLYPSAGTIVCRYRLQVCLCSHWELPVAVPRTFIFIFHLKRAFAGKVCKVVEMAEMPFSSGAKQHNGMVYILDHD